MNRNAYIGKNVEVLFKNSIGDHQKIIQKIQENFKIQGNFITAICSGVHNEKVDVKMEFSCGRNIDANIKSFQTGLNQLTRTTPEKFCEKFNLDCLKWLQNLLVEKAKRGATKYDFFPESEKEKAVLIFKPIVKDIVEWSMSYKKAREILVLYDRQESVMHIYSMKNILKHLKYDISFTPKGGNLLIGNLIIFKRKGGNGKLCSHKIKTDPTHPGNNIQLQLRMYEFIKEMKNYELGNYVI